MPVVYVSQDGPAPSGISTYGFHVLRAWPDARMVLLNASALPLAAPPDVANRVILVSEAESHDVSAVAGRLVEVLDRLSGVVTFLPNTGDTPWSAVVRMVREVNAETRKRIRVLGIVHSDVETQYDLAMRHATFAAAWVGVSRRITQILQARLALPGPGAVTTLPYPMDLPTEGTMVPTTSTLRLAYVGRLEEQQKRVSRLARLFILLQRRGVDFRATIVGDGPARHDLIAAVREGPAANQVEFTGALDAVGIATVLRRSDVFLLTSDYEGLPLALLEAMAARVCPVVMRFASGVEDVLRSGQNSIVTPAGDDEAFADAVAGLASDSLLLERLRTEARQTIARDFSPREHFQQLRLIVETCSQRPPPDPASVPETDPTAAAVEDLIARARRVRAPVAIYGAGMLGRKVVDACLDAGLDLVAWIDSDPARSGVAYRGLSCAGPDELARWPEAAVLVGSLQFADEITQRVHALAMQSGRSPPLVISASLNQKT